MIKDDNETLPVLRYVCGESDQICRVCFSSTEREGVSFEESRVLQCYYFDGTVSFIDMLTELGVSQESGLPTALCACCANSTINAFLFLKLCRTSNNKWHCVLNRFSESLNLINRIGPSAKTAFLVLGNKNIILKSRKVINKENAITHVKDLFKARQTYHKNKRKSTLESVICDECGELFHCRITLERHMSSHSHKRYACQQCPKLFIYKSQVFEHNERVHNPKTIQCPKCPKKFSTLKLLRYHDGAHHLAVICKRCFKQFPSKHMLRQHMDKHDTVECHRCGSIYHNRQWLKRHLKTCGLSNDKEIKFFCDICNKGYRRRSGIRAHIIMEHGFGPAHVCKWCNKKYDSLSRLNCHIVKHTRERKFFCNVCDGRFLSSIALKYHMRIHTGEKPVSCEMCGESFLSTSRKNDHIRRKHIGKNKECQICESKFVTSFELRRHIARHNNPQSKLFISK